MSNFVVGVGGSGAKFVASLLHVSAAGMLGARNPVIDALLVDPDENNGNVEDCLRLVAQYQDCKTLLKMGKTDLFGAHFRIAGPWTPISRPDLDSLDKLFQYPDLQARDDVDAELLDVFFEPAELSLPLKLGFRGRPAIGSTVFANSVNFTRGAWKDLIEAIVMSGAQGPVRVMLSGSVFGGSGAAGVPTLVRLVEKQIARRVPDLRIGLALFLPYFRFQPVEGERVQADPAAFPIATAESLRYYFARNYLGICDTIYACGEEVPAEMSVSAIGAQLQRNEPHFVELIAAMGALRFFNLAGDDHKLAVCARAKDETLTWDDLPYDDTGRAELTRKLQKMALFAVAYRNIFFPLAETALAGRGSNWNPWVDHIERPKVNRDEAGRALRALKAYVDSFLTWLLCVSTPRRQAFQPGLVNPNVFAVATPQGWQLKAPGQFRDEDLSQLLLNRPARARIDVKTVNSKAAAKVSDPDAAGPGRLARALYDACEVE